MKGNTSMINLKRRASRRALSCVAYGALVVTLGAAPALASTTTTTMAVTATVLSSCLVVATPLVFGNYSSSSATPTDATSTVTATCTAGTPYTVALDSGTTSGATVAARALANLALTTDQLNYNLYTNAGHSTLWGDGTSSTVTQGNNNPGVTPDIYTVYGRIPVHQNVSALAYTDLVTVTLTY